MPRRSHGRSLNGRRRRLSPETQLRRSPRFPPQNDDLGRPARHHQTPLRRSPRFLTNNKKNYGEEEARKQTKPRLQPGPEAHASAKKTPQWCSEKCSNWRSVPPKRRTVTQSVRRSPRLASNPADPTSTEDAERTLERNLAEGQKRVLGRKEMSHQRLRRSARIAPEVRKSGAADVDSREDIGRGKAERVQRKRGNPTVVVLTPREVAERKKRKVEMGSREDAGAGVRGTEEECYGLQGWTKQQEAALQRAYLTAKPSPHFWKKVSKMVPGKSAKDCFDRVHADLATPPQPQPRSRTRKLNTSPIGSINLSVGKPMELTVPKIRRPRSSKQKNLVAQKTVRHLLRKHRLIDQKQEADLFSVLENSQTAFTLDFPEIKTPASTPNCLLNAPGFLQKCNERSSSAHNKMLSRFKTVNEANLESPEVLKQVKNMALHEKYIDHLHCREARRKARAKTANSDAGKDYKNEGTAKPFVLKAARHALICEAKDVISQFQSMQANIMDNDESLDIDDNDAYSDDDE